MADSAQNYIQKVKQLNEKKDTPPLAHVHNYGCQLNVTDGEKMKGQLLKLGFGLTERPEEADFVIFNTCAVREGAEEHVFGNLGFLKQYKEKNKDMIICIAGCMSEQSAVVEKIKKSYKYVDIVFGTNAISKLPRLIYEVYMGRKHVYDMSEQSSSVTEGIEQIRNSTFKASVPVMYGCNNFCTYCIVPYVRGRERSRQPDVIINEIKELVKNGYKEIFLLGQNVNSYGNDLEENISFPWLLRQINKIDGEFIVRFMSSHPKDAGRELIDAICDCDKVAKHLHLPLQSGSNDILEKMNRRYTHEKYMEIINYARERISDFSFSTDIIVGFPNETESDFESTLDILKKVKYDNIYSYIYSKWAGTKAALIDDLVTYEEKQKRIQRLLELQRDISTDNYKRFIGTTLTVLAESEGKGGEGSLTGKSNEFIIVNFSGDKSLIGSFVNVKITAARNWAVYGELISQ